MCTTSRNTAITTTTTRVYDGKKRPSASGNNDHYYTCVRQVETRSPLRPVCTTATTTTTTTTTATLLLQREICTLLTAKMASTDLLPTNNKQKGRKDWSNDATFIAALDEWNSNRPVGNKEKPMPMTAFCKLRDIPYRTFLRHCKSDETKEDEKKQRRECYAENSVETKAAARKKSRENYAKRRATATESDDMKEATKKQKREHDAKRRATMSDDMK